MSSHWPWCPAETKFVSKSISMTIPHFVPHRGRKIDFSGHSANRIACSPAAWPAKSLSWHHSDGWGANFNGKPCGKPGCPSKGWDGTVKLFTTQFLNDEKWWHVANDASCWFTLAKPYVELC